MATTVTSPPVPIAKLTAIAANSGRPLDEVIEIWTERAAIREYDGGATRQDAQEAALYDVANIVGGRKAKHEQIALGIRGAR